MPSVSETNCAPFFCDVVHHFAPCSKIGGYHHSPDIAAVQQTAADVVITVFELVDVYLLKVFVGGKARAG